MRTLERRFTAHALRHNPQRPKITRQLAIRKILIRHPEISPNTPSSAPRVPHQPRALTVIIPHNHNGMAPDRLLVRHRHRHHPRLGHLRALKALIHREPPDERVSLRQTALHDRLLLRDPVVRNRLVLQRVRVQLRWRLLARRRVGRPRAVRPRRGGVIGPLSLGADALLVDSGDAVADLRAAVGRRAALDLALVVVDEEARGHEVPQVLLQQLELEGPRYGVGRAGADLPLVVDGGAVRAEIGAGRQVVGYGLGRHEHKVARVWEVGLPAVAGDAAGGGRGDGLLVVVFLVMMRHGEGAGGECWVWGEVGFG